MQIKEIQTREEILSALQLLKKNYPEISVDLSSLIEKGYKMAAVFESASCLGAVGIRVIQKLRYGNIIEIEDFILDENHKTSEVAKSMFAWIEQQAKIFNCQSIAINLATKNLQLQKIFAQEKFILDEFLFRKNCNF